MNVLILGNPKSYENKRLKKEGALLGHKITVTPFKELKFKAQGKIKIFAKDRDILDYNAILFGRFVPIYVSQALTIAEFMHRAGKIVVDRDLATGNFIYDKMRDYILLGQNGIACPKTIQVFQQAKIKKLLPNFSFPVILKEVHSSLGKRIYLVKDKKRLNKILGRNKKRSFALQEFFNTKNDLRIMVIGYKALGAIKRTAPKNGFRTNYSQGGRGEKIILSPQIKKMAEKAARVLKKPIAGVDVIIYRNKPYILEVNRFPGFEQFEKVSGINIARAIIKHITNRKQ